VLLAQWASVLLPEPCLDALSVENMQFGVFARQRRNHVTLFELVEADYALVNDLKPLLLVGFTHKVLE